MTNNIDAILDGLNDEQRKAVCCVDGPVLIIAGAGSGKTTVLTRRIAMMLEKGIDPGNILALTFTKKAATEMKERISLMVGSKAARKVFMGTFHAIFVRFLREYADSIGYPSSFTIYDTSDTQSAIKTCIKALGLDENVYKPKAILTRISMAKNNLVTHTAYRNNSQAITKDQTAKMPRLCDVYSMYATRCKELGVMDFDDILLNMNILLRDNPQALKALSERFTHIMVDEYQDTNFAQYLIIKKLAQANRNICVVGDDSQSIYSFRGAQIQNILNFQKDFSDAKLIKLVKNYRSTRMIVGAANSIIERNKERIPKECQANTVEDGEKILLLRAFSEIEEASIIADRILARIMKEKAQYRDFAILYRTNSQSNKLEEALRRRNLPYQIYSGNEFFKRQEIKDAMSYFKLLCNPHDDEAFKRAVNRPARGIGETSISALENAAKALKTSLFKAVYDPSVEQYGLKSAATNKIKAFCEMINKFAMRSQRDDAYILGSDILNESGLYMSFKADTSMEGQNRCANIEELMDSVKQFVEEKNAEATQELESEGLSASQLPIVTLQNYLEETSLLSSVDVSEDDENANNKISLMTVHSSKGLEFPYVFIAGVEENIFPSGGTYIDARELEEERRLFYVAVTRAKKAVFISFADSRMKNGKTQNNSPSRFVRELNPFYVANPLMADDNYSVETDPLEIAKRNASLRSSSPGWTPGGSGPVKFQPRSSRPQAPVTPSMPSAGPNSERKVLVNTKTGNKVPVYVSGIQPSPSQQDLNIVSDPMDSFKVGDRIVHSKFGSGAVLELKGAIPDVKAVIAFDKFGEKTIMLKFAKICHESLLKR